MIGQIKCRIGLHAGKMQTKHEIKENQGVQIDGLSAFVCSRCEAVIE